jgi:2-succinyl-5-enolpyruvyl-6-hydroxy-3-cyclohexene-1-carboxylate synthase
LNIELATQSIRTLNDLGVADFVICAGARNAPLVKVLGQAIGANIRYFYDERAAGFWAMGVARRKGRPVAVVTTSGTAAAELLPATIEAHYTGVPLVLVTADRPREYRGSGAPQAIEQVGIFSSYVQSCFDIAQVEELRAVSELAQPLARPLHLNICFSEPLIDATVPQLQIHRNDIVKSELPVAVNPDFGSKIKSFFQKVKKPLVVVGAVQESERGRLQETLVALGAPVYIEAQSGLREDSALAELIIRSGELSLSASRVTEVFDGLLRIGSVPTLRLWRDLDLGLSHWPVLSVCENHFSGLARESDVVDFSNFFDFMVARSKTDSIDHERSAEFLKTESDRAKKLEQLIQKYPTSEVAQFRRLSEMIPSEDFVFVGNSLPIREWDLAATYARPHARAFANRGANGIDGLISTFLGMCQPNRSNWVVLGDLSALYDLNALSAATDEQTLRIVVVNNGGGRIFDRMFQDKAFLNGHNLNFQKWAEMFGFSYVLWTPDSQSREEGRHVVIEIQPDVEASSHFWREYAELCR